MALLAEPTVDSDPRERFDRTNDPVPRLPDHGAAPELPRRAAVPLAEGSRKIARVDVGLRGEVGGRPYPIILADRGFYAIEPMRARGHAWRRGAGDRGEHVEHDALAREPGHGIARRRLAREPRSQRRQDAVRTGRRALAKYVGARPQRVQPRGGELDDGEPHLARSVHVRVMVARGMRDHVASGERLRLASVALVVGAPAHDAERRDTTCLSALPSSFIAAPYERNPSVVIASGEPWRFSVFFMKRSAASLSRVRVT